MAFNVLTGPFKAFFNIIYIFYIFVLHLNYVLNTYY